MEPNAKQICLEMFSRDENLVFSAEVQWLWSSLSLPKGNVPQKSPEKDPPPLDDRINL